MNFYQIGVCNNVGSSYSPGTANNLVIPNSNGPFEIWMRNTSVSSFSGTVNAQTYYNTLAANGFQLVFSGTITKGGGNRKNTVNFNQGSFLYDGTSSVEVVMRSQRTSSSTSNYGFNLYCYVPINTSTMTSRYTFVSNSNTADFGNFTNTYYTPMVDWFYNVPPGLDSTLVNVTNLASNTVSNPRLSDREYVLFNGIITINNAQNIYLANKLKSITVKLNNSENVSVSKMHLYNTNPTLTQTSPIVTLHYPAGDLITIPYPDNRPALSNGNNSFWVSIETEYPKSSELLSGESVSGYMYSVDIDDDIYDSRYFNPASINSYSDIVYNPVVYVPGGGGSGNVLDGADYLVCSNTESTVYTATPYNGSVKKYEWSLWNAGNTSWKEVQGATSNVLNIYTDDIIHGYNKARILAIPADANETIQGMEFSLSVSFPPQDVFVTLNGDTLTSRDTFRMCIGEYSEYIGYYNGNAKSLQWQYKSDIDGEWYPFSQYEVPTVFDKVLRFAPSDMYKNVSIRFAVQSDEICNSWEVSDAFTIVALTTNNHFSTQPPRHYSVCRGERFYITAIFSGETPTSRQWYKDGVPLESHTGSVFDINRVELSDAGRYWYSVETVSCHGPETTTSDTVHLFINPASTIIRQPSTVKALENDIAVFPIDANYYYDGTAENIFRWFKYNGITNTNTLLAETERVKGTKSNILTIFPVSPEDYTYNGDYYFCELYAICDMATTRSRPIYLLPGHQMVITRHPKSVDLCYSNLPQTVRFDVYAYHSLDETKLTYQWYSLDGNGNETALLRSQFLSLPVNGANASTFEGMKYYCVVWYDGDDPLTEGINSDTVTINISYPIALSGEVDDIELYIGDPIILNATKYLTTTGPSSPASYVLEVKWFNDIEGVYYEIPTKTTLLPDALYFNIPNIGIHQSGTYVARIITLCNTVEQRFNITVSTKPGVTSIVENYNIELMVSPNPATNFVNFTFTAPSNKKYAAEITDIAGAIVCSFNGITTTHNNIKLDIYEQKLTNGSYIFNLFIDGKKTTKSFVIAK